MKRFRSILFAIVLIAILIAPICYALNVTSSRAITSDVAVTTKAGYLTGVYLLATEGSSGTVIIYDNATEASGVTSMLLQMSVSGVTTYQTSREWTHPVHFNNGLYVDLSSGVTVFLEYTNE